MLYVPLEVNLFASAIAPASTKYFRQRSSIPPVVKITLAPESKNGKNKHEKLYTFKVHSFFKQRFARFLLDKFRLNTNDFSKFYTIMCGSCHIQKVIIAVDI